MIVKIPFRGAFVVEVSARDVAEIASIRLLVEPYAGELALETLRGPERPRLTQTVEELRQATDKNDIPASIDAHLRFHRLFYGLSGHGILQSLWNGWEIKLRLYLTMDYRTYSDPHDIAVEHERLAAIALEGDMDARVAAGNPSPQGVTASLATAAALRAFGSAAAVALAPRIISEAGISGLSVALVTLLLATMVVTLAWHRSQSSLLRTGPAAHPG